LFVLVKKALDKLGWSYWETKRPRMIRSRSELGTLLVTCSGKVMTMGCKNESVANSLVQKFLQVIDLVCSSEPVRLSSTYTACVNSWRKAFFTDLVEFINRNPQLPHRYDGEIFPSVLTLRLKPNCGLCVNFSNTGKCTFLGVKSDKDLQAAVAMVHNLFDKIAFSEI
jgi:TATA-box binding protein (TBP) (component of TFIID and TFIIIB)